MKHRNKQRILHRERSQRISLLRGLTHELLLHGSIVTTKPKAQELRRYFEPLITTAKKGLTLASRRRLMGALRTPDDLGPLVNVAKTHVDRPGGYVRITRLPARASDHAELVRVDILEADLQSK